jgi:hypothetical protein
MCPFVAVSDQRPKRSLHQNERQCPSVWSACVARASATPERAPAGQLEPADAVPSPLLIDGRPTLPFWAARPLCQGPAGPELR